MSSRVNVCSVNILDNPSLFADNLKLEVTFEVFEQLPKDLEWELVWVGSPSDETKDQLLESILVGPTPEGRHKFIFEAKPPNADKIPSSDLLGVTVLLLRVKYDSQEFLNLGWYVKVDYKDAELAENPPSSPVIDKLNREVLTDDLRVTTYAIKWDESQQEEYPPEVENPDEDVITDDDEEGEEESEDDDSSNEMEDSVTKKSTKKEAGDEEPMDEEVDDTVKDVDKKTEKMTMEEKKEEEVNVNEKTALSSAEPLSDATNV